MFSLRTRGTRVLAACALLVLAQAATGMPTATAQCPGLYAGTLASDPIEPLPGGVFALTAFRQNNLVLGPNSDVRYLLSVGAERRLVATAAAPRFEVRTPGYYRIHTLVGELSDSTDADYLPAGLLAADGRTVVEVAQAFGARCADLDQAGTVFFVPSDYGVPCDAVPGRLGPEAGTFTPDGAAVDLAARVVTPATGRPALERAYVLTRGNDNVVTAVGAAPSFRVPALDTGLYTVYSFVAELDDQLSLSYFDLSRVAFGRVGLDAFVSDYVDRDLCAAVGFEGGQVYVPREPLPGACLVESGAVAASAQVLSPGADTVYLTAERTTAALALAGQERTFVLADAEAGGRVLGYSDVARFAVTRPGSFAVHAVTLEHTDPASAEYYDLEGAVRGGVSVDQLAADLVQAGVCASVDSLGADFDVSEQLLTSPVRSPAALVGAPRLVTRGGTLELLVETDDVLDARVAVYDLAGRAVLPATHVVLPAGDHRLALGRVTPGVGVVVELRSRDGATALRGLAY